MITKADCLRYPGQPDTHTRVELTEYFQDLEAKTQVVLLRARSSYLSEADPIDSGMHSNSADTIQRLLKALEGMATNR